MTKTAAQTEAQPEVSSQEVDRRHALARLLEIAQELPDDKLVEVLDFVEFLHARYAAPPQPKRGSPEAILQALERVGPLQFEPGELDRLLAEIEEMRLMDLKEHGELPA